MDFEKNSRLSICDTVIQPGERVTLALPTPEIYTCAPSYIPIHVIHGKRKGPCLLVCAALHGDEINGVAIIQKLLEIDLLNKISGTLIAIPVMNIFGLITQSRHLLDRRDLAGSFPGSETGSFASRLAYLLTTEVLSKVTHCIDIHTGEPHIRQMPHIETDLDRKDCLEFAKAFDAPMILHSTDAQGMLWQLKKEDGIPTVIFEGGEALKFDPDTIKTGIKGILSSLRHLGMLSKKQTKMRQRMTARSTFVVTSPGSGMCELNTVIGKYVSKGEKLATITDPFGTRQKFTVHAPIEGMIISCNSYPLVNEGESLIVIADVNIAQMDTIPNWSPTEMEYE